MLRLARVSLPLAEFTLCLDGAFPGPVTGVVGPSGAGKSSFLELIAGLRRPESGRMELGGEVFFDAASRPQPWIPPSRRRIGYVPQDDTLFPHLSVRRNLTYGIPAEGSSPSDFQRAVDVLELRPLLDRATGRLSGGERRRVAIGRAILSQPRMILCDEPLTGLDRPLKARILAHLEAVKAEFAIPMVYVAHDAEEIRVLADEVVVLERGAIRHHGPSAGWEVASRGGEGGS